MKKLIISIKITREQYMEYYRGSVRNVITKATNGQRVQFPANILQPFVSHNGIEGIFELEFDQNYKFSKIRRIG